MKMNLKKSTRKIKNLINRRVGGCYIKETRKGAYSILLEGIFNFSPSEQGYKYLSLCGWDATQLVDEHVCVAYNAVVETELFNNVQRLAFAN